MKPATASAPGRVNLIGEHVDYHSLPVLPVAIGQRVTVRYTRSAGTRMDASSTDGYPPRSFEWTPSIAPYEAGDWGNYLKAAAQAVASRWGVHRGIQAQVSGNIPAAAGLSSSSALLVAVTLALLRANEIEASLEELMEILPDGEQYVGTRGGGMDHAISLAGQAGCAMEIHFQPFRLRAIPIPSDWGFLAAHSTVTAEKSSAVREAYNLRRFAGQRALAALGASSYQSLLDSHTEAELQRMAAERLDDPLERLCFLHVVTEAARVGRAIAALESADAGAFGRILNEGHASLRDQLQVSCPEVDRLVDCARAAGALGARLTGAGFGGCAIVFAKRMDLLAIKHKLTDLFYSGKPGLILEVEPSGGALAAEGTAASPRQHEPPRST